MSARLFEDILRQGVPVDGGKGPSLSLLDDVWETLVGKDLAIKIRPLGWDKGELSVLVIDTTWFEALRRQQGALRSRIQRFFPWPVKRLKWTVAQEGDPTFSRDQTLDPQRPALEGMSPL